MPFLRLNLRKKETSMNILRPKINYFFFRLYRKKVNIN